MMDNNQNLIKAALQYLRMGFSVIPIKSEETEPDPEERKRSHVKWKTNQSEKADAEQIRKWWRKWPAANIGIVTGEISGIAVVDVDSPEANKALDQEYLPDSRLIPSVRTPRGWHYYFQYQDRIGTKGGFMENCDIRGEGGYIIAPPSRGPDGKDYLWLPGRSIEEVPLSPMPQPLYNKIFFSLYRVDDIANNGGDNNRQQTPTNDNIRFDFGYRDDNMFHVALHLVRGGMPTGEIQQLLQLIGLNLCSPTFTQKEISAKIQSALKRCQGQKRSLTQDIRDLISTTSGNISTTFVYNCQHLVTREDKNKATTILSRLAKEGLIEPTGRIAGEYRRIETEAPAIDFVNAADEAFPIEWPFALEELASLHPKNIAVIAGTQNSGKTALALNITQMNMKRYAGRIRYMSSEMGAVELKGRLKKFGLPLEDWKAVDFRERSSDFSDLLLPDGFNVIDFYEISDQFWKIAADLKRIYDKLNNGIAIVCLQKSEGKDMGRGGDFGLEKPRIYLNIDPDPPNGGVLTIRRAKSWAKEGKNPNWYKVKFKIVNGAKLIQQGGWFLEPR